MIDRRILLYFYPTTWVFVDDEERFLTAMELMLGGARPCALLLNPLKAQKFLEERTGIANKIAPEIIRSSEEGVLVRFSPEVLVEDVAGFSKFEEVSVVVSDYAMPGMNGLELFAKLKPSVYKNVLLTGVADEKIAVEAFNDGSIDRFFSKDNLGTLETLLEHLYLLEHDRFSELQEPLLGLLPQDVREFITDEEFRKIFFAELTRLDIAEYYLSIAPFGFYLLDSAGSPFFISLATTERLDRAFLSLSKHISDSDFLLDMRHYKVQTEIFEPLDSSSASDYDFEFNTVRLSAVPGSRSRFWGLHTSPAIDVDYDSEVSSLIRYLEAKQYPYE